jgi:hypothetical protein
MSHHHHRDCCCKEHLDRCREIKVMVCEPHPDPPEFGRGFRGREREFRPEFREREREEREFGRFFPF